MAKEVTVVTSYHFSFNSTFATTSIFMKNITYTILFITFALNSFSQDSITNISGTGMEGFAFNDSYRGSNSIRVMFYNVENLFDIYDDSLKNDESFTPEGDHHWNNYKYYEKLNNISKTMVAVGGWEAVEIIGLCEIENRKVLDDLVKHKSLKPTNYQILHQESPDKRGIDVALLYRSDKIKVDTVQWINVFLGTGQRPTRDILYATLRTENEAVFHVFVNHWPSRYGGQMKSDPKRKTAARTIRVVVDSILASSTQANILLMGDFNDEPDNESIHDVLRAKNDTSFADSTELYNMMSNIHGNRGSHKYQGNWGVLDQFMVSKSLYNGENRLKTEDGPLIFSAPFLFTEETKYPGLKPYRTYNGRKYSAGYSDHLPIFIDLQLLK